MLVFLPIAKSIIIPEIFTKNGPLAVLPSPYKNNLNQLLYIHQSKKLQIILNLL